MEAYASFKAASIGFMPPAKTMRAKPRDMRAPDV